MRKSGYSDIIFPPETVQRLLANEHDIAIAVDPEWRGRYAGRTQHLPSEAELVRARDGKLVEAGKGIPPDGTVGEFIGIVKITARVAPVVHEHLEAAVANDVSMRERYLTSLFNSLAAQGHEIGIVLSDVCWHEIDTIQDLRRAEKIIASEK